MNRFKNEPSKVNQIIKQANQGKNSATTHFHKAPHPPQTVIMCQICNVQQMFTGISFSYNQC